MKLHTCVDCAKDLTYMDAVLPGMVIDNHLARCYHCGFIATWKDQYTCQQPFKTPPPRLLKDGELPPSFLDRIA